MDSSIKRGLFSQTPTLLNKKKDFLDEFDNNIMVRLELDTELASTPVSTKLSFFQTLDKKNMFNLKCEFVILGNARNPYPP